ncbi:MAG TPA: hypothetical protein VGE26_09640 [Sphingobacteriaceae bacterium]
MNFLSHFYFDRHSSDPHLVMGGALPDLVKNVRKDWNFHPEKYEDKYRSAELASLLTGWKRHLEIDKHFHSSDFFFQHTVNLRTVMAPVLEQSPVRSFFLAHIALELMLDSLLITEGVIDAERFYCLLSKCKNSTLKTFLQLNKADQPELFFPFLKEFIHARYLHSYREAHNIMYALTRICMRIWPDPLTETQKLQLTAILPEYREKLQPTFMSIFHEIGKRLS